MSASISPDYRAERGVKAGVGEDDRGRRRRYVYGRVAPIDGSLCQRLKGALLAHRSSAIAPIRRRGRVADPSPLGRREPGTAHASARPAPSTRVVGKNRVTSGKRAALRSPGQRALRHCVRPRDRVSPRSARDHRILLVSPVTARTRQRQGDPVRCSRRASA